MNDTVQHLDWNPYSLPREIEEAIGLVSANFAQTEEFIQSAIAAGLDVEIGLAVKARSSFRRTWFGGYTGPWLAYIPTADEYPNKGYEVDTTPFTPEAAGILVEESSRLLEEITDRHLYTR